MTRSFKAKLLSLYPEFSRVDGPYTYKSTGRSIVCLVGSDARKSISYPKAMMEVKLSRRLGRDEWVDHKDEDHTNNTYANFQILSPSKNTIKSVIARGAAEKMIGLVCAGCGGSFQRAARVVKRNQAVRGEAGPFCGKPCAGRYGTDVQKIIRAKELGIGPT